MYQDTKQSILNHFHNGWEQFYGRFVHLPTEHHNGSVKVSSPFRDDDDTPSFEITLSGKYEGTWCDWGTDERGDPFSFYALMHNLDVKQDFPAVLKAMADEFNIPVSVNGQTKSKPTGPKKVKTLAERGVSEETAKAFRIREEPGDRWLSHRIIFPVTEGRTKFM